MLEYFIGTLICRLSWLGFRMSLFLCFIAILVWYIDMPIIIGCSPCFAWYSDSVSSWLFCSLHMHRLTIVHCLTCCVVFSGLHIILIVFWAWCSYHYSSWLSRLVCIHEWYILYSAWLHVAWLPFFYLIACRLSMWVALLSPYLQLSWFRSFLSSRFPLLQVWDLLCACSLTEPEIRSRV